MAKELMSRGASEQEVLPYGWTYVRKTGRQDFLATARRTDATTIARPHKKDCRMRNLAIKTSKGDSTAAVGDAGFATLARVKKIRFKGERGRGKGRRSYALLQPVFPFPFPPYPFNHWFFPMRALIASRAK